MSEHTDVVTEPKSNLSSAHRREKYRDGSRHNCDRATMSRSPHLLRRAGGTAAKASADIRRSFAVCSEAFAAALIWVGVSRIFFTYQVAYCSGFPLSLYTV